MYRSTFTDDDDPGPAAINTQSHPFEPRHPHSSHCRRHNTFWHKLRSSSVIASLGFMLVAFSSAILFWNEGRAVQTSLSLEEALRNVRVLKTTDVAFEENNNKLVYLSGYLQTNKELSDTEYNIAIKAVKMRRRVQMFQWIERSNAKEISEGDGARIETTYSYSAEWKSDLIDSTIFDNPVAYQNPVAFPIESTVYVADMVKVGNFIVSKGMVDVISNFQSFTGHERPSNPSIKMHMGLYYHSGDVWNPQVGDARLEFAYAGLAGDEHADMVSIIGKQVGRELRPYRTVAGDTIELLYTGKKSPEDIFRMEMSTNTFLTWALRGLGWLVMYVGFTLMTNILNSMVSFFPVMRDIIQLGVSSINFSCSVSTSLLVIALGWLWYRPLLGIFLLGLALMPFMSALVKICRRDNNENRYRRA